MRLPTSLRCLPALLALSACSTPYPDTAARSYAGGAARSLPPTQAQEAFPFPAAVASSAQLSGRSRAQIEQQRTAQVLAQAQRRGQFVDSPLYGAVPQPVPGAILPPTPSAARAGECYELVQQPLASRFEVPRLEWRSRPCAPQAGAVLAEPTLGRAAVRRLQDALRAANHDPGPTDGIIGPRTRAALDAYQQRRGLPQQPRLNQPTLASLGLASG